MRAGMALDTYTRWCERSSTEIEYILSLDTSDRTDYSFPEYHGIELKIIRNDNQNAVQAINNGADKATGDILIVVSDDFDCPTNWDEKILAETENVEDFVLRVKDGLQKYIITMPIMDRKYYQRFGYIYHPGFEHMFCDTYLTCVADKLKKIYDSGLLFPHNHYSRTGKKDKVSAKADATWKQGEELFIKLAKEGFGVEGEISDKKMIAWLRIHEVDA